MTATIRSLRWLLLGCVLVAGGSRAVAQLGDITATGGWTRTISASDLTGGAGSNLTSQYDSATNATTININVSVLVGVTVRRVGVNWHDDLQLQVRRSSNGSGLGSISGGTSFQALGLVDQQLFSVLLLRSNVTAQYRLTGMSVSVPPGSYSSTVIYTLIGL